MTSVALAERRARRRRLTWAAGLLAVAGALAAGAWFVPGLIRSTGRADGPPRPTVLVVSGDTAGWIVPCGCTSNQSGGLPRRGSYVGALRRDADVIVTDAGGAPGGSTDYQRLKFEAILRGEVAMGLDVHNLGGPEAALGLDYLRQAAARLNVPFVSANLRGRDGTPVAPALRVIERGGRRIAVAGVLSRRCAGPETQVDDPRDAVLRAAAEARGRYDSLVVLAYLPEEELRQLAAGLPEADAVVGGPTGQSIAPQPVGPTLLGAATNKGKFLVRLDAGGAGLKPAWSGEVVEMGPELPDDADQQENLRRYLGELAERDFAAGQTGLAAPLPAGLPADYRLAGDRSCAACHKGDHETWEGTGHAHAWQTLAERGAHVDPACQQCHSTGYGLPGGFESVARNADARSVRCESCHGPSLAHTRDPRVHTPFAPRDQCTRCHDRENSPTFAFGAYWPKVRHGLPAEKGRAGGY